MRLRGRWEALRVLVQVERGNPLFFCMSYFQCVK